MWLLELVWRPEANIGAADFENALQALLACWLHNGQIGDDYVIARDQNAWRVIAEAPERSSLDEANDSAHARKYRAQLRTIARSDFIIERALRSAERVETCACATPGSFVVQTNFLGRLSPVMCDDCGSPAPLYRFAPTHGEDHYAIWNWTHRYQAADRLYMSSGALEKEALAQLMSPDGELNAEGRELARKLEEASGKPFYFYLLRVESEEGRGLDSEACPSCSRPWRLSLARGNFDFRCEPCRLVAHSVSSDE